MKFILFFVFSLFFQSLSADIFNPFGTDNEDFSGDFEGNKWSEESTSIPELPEEQNLIEFNPGTSYSQYHYLIDKKTLSVGKKDEVVRFIIVIRSSSGAVNTYYQGLNCIEKEIKTYAYAHALSTNFIASTSSYWREISDSGAMGYSKGLAEFYFCKFPDSALTRKEILNKLKYERYNEE